MSDLLNAEQAVIDEALASKTAESTAFLVLEYVADAEFVQDVKDFQRGVEGWSWVYDQGSLSTVVALVRDEVFSMEAAVIVYVNDLDFEHSGLFEAWRENR